MENSHDKSSAFAAQQKLSLVQLLWELPNYIGLVISAVLSRSMLVWMDLIDSTHILCRATFVIVLTGKLKKNLSFQYNYGTGKVEAISSLCCDVMLLVSLVAAGVFAINNLLNPFPTSNLLVWVVLLKIENVVFDIYILVKQQKNKVESELYRAERSANIKNFTFDTFLLIVLIATYFLRDLQWSWYISPAFSIGFVLAFTFHTILRMRKAVLELVDTTCDEQTQQNILKVLAALYDHYDDFIEVKSRKNSDQLIIDIYLRFQPETTYEQISQFTKTASERLQELNPNSIVSVVIRGE